MGQLTWKSGMFHDVCWVESKFIGPNDCITFQCQIQSVASNLKFTITGYSLVNQGLTVQFYNLTLAYNLTQHKSSTLVYTFSPTESKFSTSLTVFNSQLGMLASCYFKHNMLSHWVNNTHQKMTPSHHVLAQHTGLPARTITECSKWVCEPTHDTVKWLKADVALGVLGPHPSQHAETNWPISFRNLTKLH